MDVKKVIDKLGMRIGQLEVDVFILGTQLEEKDQVILHKDNKIKELEEKIKRYEETSLPEKEG